MPIEQLTRIGRARPIVRWGAPVLHQPAEAVIDFGPELQDLLADLFATNRAASGAGIAAPQLGVGLSAFVYDCVDATFERRTGVVCNPTIEEPAGRERRLEVWDEGCLSFPGAAAELGRANQVACTGQDQYGDAVRIVGTGLLARCLQHETDHLQGIVFADRLPARRRRELERAQAAAASDFGPDWPADPV